MTRSLLANNHPSHEQNNDFALASRLPSDIERAEAGRKRVLSGMVAETLALANRKVHGQKLPLRTDEDAEYLYQKGLRFYHGSGCVKDFLAAATFIRRAAAMGHVDAQYTLGVLLQNGRGVSKDHTEAAKLYRAAAEKGHADAQNNLGWMFSQGHGVSRDDVEALKWYQMAAEQGNEKGQFNVGHAYLCGKGVPQDDHEAYRWLRLAVELGCKDTSGALIVAGASLDPEEREEAERWIKESKFKFTGRSDTRPPADIPIEPVAWEGPPLDD